jgi:hypothetical protein
VGWAIDVLHPLAASSRTAVAVGETDSAGGISVSA